MTAIRLLPLVFLAFACITPLSLEERPCPCSEGWTCCDDVNVCVREGATCPESTPMPAGECDGGDCSDAGSLDCSGACELGARECHYQDGARECRLAESGCGEWVEDLACIPDEACFYSETGSYTCKCAGSDCLAITGISPGPPYQAGQEIRVDVTNPGNFRVYFSANHLGQPEPTRLGSSPGQIFVTIPSFDSIPTGGFADVVLTVTGDSSLEQRVLRVHGTLPSFVGTFDVRWMGAEPRAVEAGSTTEFKYEIRSRANQAADVRLTPSVLRCASCESGLRRTTEWNGHMQLVASDGGLLVDSEIRVEPDSAEEFSVRLTNVPESTDGGSYALLVEAASGGIEAAVGYTPFTVGAPLEAPAQHFSFDLFDVDPELALESGVIRSSVGELVDLTVLCEVPAGTWDLAISTTAQTLNWRAETASAPTFINNSDAGYNSWRISVLADPGASALGELRLELTERGTGETRSLTYGLWLEP